MPCAKTNDGVSLYFEDRGDGEPIVFVHEFGGEPASWDFQVAAFSDRYRCITFAARGFLPSDVPDDPKMYGQQHSTSDVLTVLDHLGIEEAHLVGTSMGSFTSLDFTLNHPDRVRSLTLVGNSSGPRNAEEQESYRSQWVGHEMRLRELLGGKGAVDVLLDDPAYKTFQQTLPSVWQAYADRLAAQSVTGAVNILKTVHWNRRSIWQDEARLKSIACPVLLVYGDEDYYLVEETNRYLEQVIPKAKREEFENTGHLANIERADRFNILFGKHIKQASGAH